MKGSADGSQKPIAMRPSRYLAATTVLAIGAGLTSMMSLASPFMLYPSSASLPTGLYIRSHSPPNVGKIVAFTPPVSAKRYQKARGQILPHGFLFMKPIIAGPGDRVCNSTDSLFVNDRFFAGTARHDANGKALPIWQGCGPLGRGQYFTFSSHVPNSFDSRYFGPINAETILGVYRPFLRWRESGSWH